MRVIVWCVHGGRRVEGATVGFVVVDDEGGG